jgi:WD40 repeat protein
MTGKNIKTLSGHTNHVTSMCYSSDSKIIMSGSWDKTIKIWDA